MASGEGGEEKRRRRWRRRRLIGAACLPRPRCFTVSAADEGPSASGAGEGDSRPKPTHLVVTVNGIVGSAENWRFAAKHFIKKHPEDVVVHCSGCNSGARTLDGVDVMGRRLAEELTCYGAAGEENVEESRVVNEIENWNEEDSAAMNFLRRRAEKSSQPR